MPYDRSAPFPEPSNTLSPGDAGPVPSASRVGAELRAARQRLGWELPDVAAALRIKLSYLEAIEDGRVADLPGNAYAVGFLRTYAAALGLNPAAVARRFRAEAQEVNRTPELSFPAPVPQRGVPPMAVVLLGALIAGSAYVGWYRWSGEAHPAVEPVPAVPERLAPLADRAAAPPPSPQVASILPPAPPVGTAPPAPSAAPPSPAPEPAAAPAAPAEPAPDAPRVLIRAKADAWVQVRERQGPVLLARLMRAGETWPVPRGAKLLLTTGNAGGTELVVDGVAAPPLGAPGALRRDVPLDGDAAKPGSPAVPPRAGSQ